MPKRYRSKPVEIDAALVKIDNLKRVAEWCGGRTVTLHQREGVEVPTINGPAVARVGHYVIRGPNDFYPCDPDTFAARWELTTNDGQEWP